jgi:hypothetical protein
VEALEGGQADFVKDRGLHPMNVANPMLDASDSLPYERPRRSGSRREFDAAPPQTIPSSQRASSVMRSGVHGGS